MACRAQACSGLASAGDLCAHCAGALLDNERAPTLQKVHVCRRLSTCAVTRALAPGVFAAVLGAPAVRALACADDELTGAILHMLFALCRADGVAATDEGGPEGVTAAHAVVHLAALEMERLREERRQPPPSAHLVLVGGLITPALAREVEGDWCARIAAEIGDDHLQAGACAVRARVLVRVAHIGSGPAWLAAAIGLNLEVHLRAIERANGQTPLIVDHARLLRVLIAHGASGAVLSGACTATAGTTVTRLAEHVRRWLLGSPELQLEASLLVMAACRAGPESLALALDRADGAMFLLEALRSATLDRGAAGAAGVDELARVAVSALDALHALVMLSTNHARLTRAESGAVGRPLACEQLVQGAPVLLTLLTRGDLLDGARAGRVFDLVEIALREPACASAHLPALCSAVIPFRSQSAMTRALLAAEAAVRCLRAVGLRGGADLRSSLVKLCTQVIKHSPPAGAECADGRYGSASSAKALVAVGDNQDALHGLCACAAFALDTHPTGVHGCSPELRDTVGTCRADGALPTDEPADEDAQDAAACATFAELCFESVLRPLMRRLPQLADTCAEGVVDLTASVLSNCACTGEASHAPYAREVLSTDFLGGRAGGMARNPPSAVLVALANRAVLAALPALSLPRLTHEVLPIALPASTEIELQLSLMPREVLRAWLTRLPGAALDAQRASVEVDVVYAFAFCCVPGSRVDASGVDAGGGAALRDAVCSFVRSTAALVHAFAPDSQLRLCRLWVAATCGAGRPGRAPVQPAPAGCFHGLELLVSAVDARGAAALQAMAVECVRWRLGLPGERARLEVRASLGAWLRTESQWLHEGAPLPAETALPAADGARTGRAALLELVCPVDAATADALVALVDEWSSDEVQLGAVLKCLRVACFAGGHASVELLVYRGLLPVLQRAVEALVTAAAGLGAAPGAHLDALSLAMELRAHVLVHNAASAHHAATTSPPQPPSTAFPRCLQLAASASHGPALLHTLNALSALLASARPDQAGAACAPPMAHLAATCTPIGARSEPGVCASSSSPRLPAALDERALCTHIGRLLAVPAINANGARLQAAATVALALLAERAVPATLDSLGTAECGQPLRAAMTASPADGGAALDAPASTAIEHMLGSDDEVAAALALRLLAVLAARRPELVERSGLLCTPLRFALLNRLVCVGGTLGPGAGAACTLIAPIASLLTALKVAGSSFEADFAHEAWNALVLRSLLRHGCFGAASAAPAAMEGRGAVSLVRACVRYTRLLVTSTAPWLGPFFARHADEQRVLLEQLGSIANGDHAWATREEGRLLLGELHALLQARSEARPEGAGREACADATDSAARVSTAARASAGIEPAVMHIHNGVLVPERLFTAVV